MGSNNKIALEIPRATSVMIIFENSSKGEQFKLLDFNTYGKEITGAWQLQLNHINGNKQQINLKSLTDLINISQTKNFAGEVIYEKIINLNTNKYQQIDLGDVQGVSELKLNDELIGTKWYGAHIYDIKNRLKEGENKISIKLTTITGNYLKSLTKNPTAQKWTKNQSYYPMGIMGPVRIV